MFDAKSLLEQIVGGAGRAPASQSAAPSSGGLDDLLRQLTQGQSGGQSGGQTGGGLGGLGDLLRNIAPPGQNSGQSQPGGASGGAGGGLGDLLEQLQKQMGGGQAGGARAPGDSSPSAPGGGLMDVLGQVLGQATSGVREGAQRIDQSTGAGDQLTDLIGRMTGKSPDELMAQIKDLIAKNPLGAGAAAGGLGALVLGTRTGRSVAVGAAKLGALALIGGLAYKAYQNYANGRPLISGDDAPQAAPQGSGFEPDAVSNETATLYIRAMIAAAAADGRIDADEQQRIVGSLAQSGNDAQAEEFLARELNNPASAADLAAAVRNGQEAVQVFTAARIAVEPDSYAENAFLSELAERLGIDPQLAAHIDRSALNLAG